MAISLNPSLTAFNPITPNNNQPVARTARPNLTTTTQRGDLSAGFEDSAQAGGNTNAIREQLDRIRGVAFDASQGNVTNADVSQEFQDGFTVAGNLGGRSNGAFPSGFLIPKTGNTPDLSVPPRSTVQSEATTDSSSSNLFSFSQSIANQVGPATLGTQGASASAILSQLREPS